MATAPLETTLPVKHSHVAPLKPSPPSKPSKPPKSSSSHDERHYFEDWCQRTGWHGVLDFYLSTQLFWKLIWLVLVLGGCFLAINQSISMLMDFNSSEQWVTSMTLVLPKNGRIEWPNMTVCSLDWLGDVARRLEEQENEASMNAKIRSAANSTGDKDSDESEEEPIENTFQRQKKTKTGTTCSNAVIACGDDPGSLEYHHTEQCCSNLAEVDDHNCFNMNPAELFGGRNVKQKDADQLIFYLLGNSDDDLNTGYRVILYLGESDGEDDYSSEFYVAPGTRNLFSLRMERHRTVARTRAIQFYKPTWPCEKELRYFGGKKYSLELCASDCRIDFAQRFCKCLIDSDYDLLTSHGYSTVNITVPKCGNRSNECYQHYDWYTNRPDDEKGPHNASTFADDSEMDTAASCEDDCPELCEYDRVDAKVSSSVLIPVSNLNKSTDIINKYIDSKTRTYTGDEVRRMIMLELYYETKLIKAIERVQRLSVDELISNIGGCLGVWSGLSLLSLVQIVIYLIRGTGDWAASRWWGSRRGE